MGVFEDALSKGQRAAGSGELELAGRYFAAAAGIALDAGEEQLARQVYLGAGDLFRRADCSSDAANSLHLALAVPATEEERGPARVMLAGVLTAIGRFDAAQMQCERTEGLARPAALDSLCSIALARGDTEAILATLAALGALEGEAAAMATQLRTASLRRLEGDLDGAEALLEALLPVLGSEPGGRGMVLGELAEVAMLRGEASAPAMWIQAKQSFESAHRRSLVLRAEMGRVRSVLELGMTPMDHELDEGLVWAGEKRLILLELDLRRVRCWLMEDVVGLARARDDALKLGLRPRAGKAELFRGIALEGPARLAALRDAEEMLSHDLPFQLRARAAHAEALAELSPEAGRNAARSLLALAEQTGMEGVLARLRAL